MMKELGTTTRTVYKVETTYPTSNEKRADDFSTYYAHAYCLADRPGGKHADLAMMRRVDLFSKRISHDLLHFKSFEDAKPVADLLNEQGRICAGWEGNEEWRKDYQRPIKARVVLEITTVHREVLS